MVFENVHESHNKQLSFDFTSADQSLEACVSWCGVGAAHRRVGLSAVRRLGHPDLFRDGDSCLHPCSLGLSEDLVLPVEVVAVGGAGVLVQCGCNLYGLLVV